MTIPLQLVDTFLLDYHVGHVFVLLFVLAILGAVVLRSWEILAVNLLLFGALFALTPAGMLGKMPSPILFRITGIVLLVFGPLIYAVMAR